MVQGQVFLKRGDCGIFTFRNCFYLVHPATDDEFVICRNAQCGQVLMLPSQRLMHPAADDDFLKLLCFLQNCVMHLKKNSIFSATIIFEKKSF